MIRQLEASFCPILNNFEKKYRVARKPVQAALRNLRFSDGYALIVNLYHLQHSQRSIYASLLFGVTVMLAGADLL
jgi:hypothetical protein